MINISGCRSSRVFVFWQTHPHDERSSGPRGLHDGWHVGRQSQQGASQFLYFFQKTIPGNENGNEMCFRFMAVKIILLLRKFIGCFLASAIVIFVFLYERINWYSKFTALFCVSVWGCYNFKRSLFCLLIKVGNDNYSVP